MAETAGLANARGICDTQFRALKVQRTRTLNF